MNHTNDCNYCVNKFKFKFKYRKWSEVTKVLYDKAVTRFSPIETITFMFKGKSWIIDYTCGAKFGVDAGAVSDDYLHLYLTEPLTYMQAKKKNESMGRDVWLTPFEEVKSLSPDKDLKRLKTISKEAAKLDLLITIDDVFGDNLHHYCGIKTIKGNEHIKIMLEEAYSCGEDK
jgi:hypothetical protein